MDTAAYRERIYDAFTDRDADVSGKVERALDVGTEYFGVPIGFLTRIDAGTQEVVQATGDHDLIRPGETCPLDEAYCRRTVDLEGTLAVQNASASPEVSAAAYDTFELGTYIGAKIVVDDEVYGTVCFADDDRRDEPFSESDELFVELLAKLVGQALERRSHERALRRRNERLAREKRRFEGIAETSFDILFRVDVDAEFTYVSSAVERVLGVSPAALMGEPITEHVLDASADATTETYRRALDGETVESVELSFLDADGDAVVLEVNATPIEDGGEVVGVQGVGRDVTGRRERERELRLKDRAMDEARLGISIADARRPGRPLVYVNGGFERITGYEEADVLGEDCRFLQGEGTDPDAVSRLAEGIAADEPTSVELLNYRADGTPFWNQVRVSPVVDDAGEVTHNLGFQADVTGRVRTERLVRLLNRVLRHNLRNEMNVLLGLGEMVAAEGRGDVADAGERIAETARRLVDLGEQARDVERNATTEREPTRLDVDDLVAGVAEGCREAFPAATVDCRVRTDRDVCAGRELEGALAELVENAVKHNPSPEPWVGVEAVDDGDRIELTVADDGEGVGEMEANVVASGEETALEHGSGLGLWSVNWVVTRYGGSFRIRAEDGGTVATVGLPAIDDDESVESVERGPTVLFR
jgi:PAS domain S-box-containing protein